MYGNGFDTGPLSGRGKVHEFLSVFVVVDRFPWAPGRLSYPPGSILGSMLPPPLPSAPSLPLFYIMQYRFWVGSLASGPDSSQESLIFAPPGRPKAGWRADCEVFPMWNPAEIRPGNPISVPEVLFRNIRHLAFNFG